MKSSMVVKVHATSGIICPKCHGNRWKTVVKGKKYACRGCGHEVENAS